MLDGVIISEAQKQAMMVNRGSRPYEATQAFWDQSAWVSKVGAAAVQANQKAFEASFQQHYARVYNLLFRLVGNRAEAEDLALEVFSRFWERKPAAVGADEGLGGWLYRVATNLGFNALRAARRRARHEVIFDDENADAQPARDADPAQAAELAAERAQVQAVLRQLKPRDAQILLLRHSGLSYKEIAAALEIAPGSVGTLLARAERAFERLYSALPTA